MIARSPDSGSPLAQARRIVVKVGSALLVDADDGRIKRAWLETLIEDLLRLRKRNQQVILVFAGSHGCEGDPLPIRRPGCFTHPMQHSGQFAGLTSVGINQPQLKR